VHGLPGEEFWPVQLLKGFMQHMVVVYNTDFKIGKGRFCQRRHKGCRSHCIVFSYDEKSRDLQAFSGGLIPFIIKGRRKVNQPGYFSRRPGDGMAGGYESTVA